MLKIHKTNTANVCTQMLTHYAHQPPQSSAVVKLTTCGCSLPTTGTKISPHFSSTHGRHNYCTHTYAATTPAGFKPSRAEPTSLACRQHNHYAKVSRQSHDECLFLYRTTRSPSRVSIRKSCPSIVLGLRMGVSLVALTWVQVFVWCGCQGKGRVLKRLGCRKKKRKTGGRALPKSDRLHLELSTGLALSHQPTLYLEPKWLW